MKALDPTSVVREGEFALAEQAAGVDDRVLNIYNKLIEGERLPPKQMDQFIETAQGLSNTAIDSANNEVDNWLNTFGDTLQPKFKQAVRKRVPTPFEIKQTAKTQKNQQSQPAQVLNFDAQGNLIP